MLEDIIHAIHLYKNDKRDQLLLSQWNLNYNKIIKMGVYLETGSDYLLYIYKNPFHPRHETEGLLFLYNTYTPNNNLNIISSSENRDPIKRLTHIRTISFFLEHNFSNTITDPPEAIFPEYKKMLQMVEEHRKKEKSEKEKFEQFKFKAGEQHINIKKEFPRRAKLAKPDYLTEEFLKRVNQELENNIFNSAGIKNRNQPATLGLAIFVESIQFNPDLFIHPVIIPISKENTEGTPQKFNSSIAKRYHFNFIHPLISEYLKKVENENKIKHPLHTKKHNIHLIYFPRLMKLLFEMPEARAFCYSKTHSNFFPLTRFVYNKLAIRFKTCSDLETILISLEFISEKGTRMVTGDFFYAISHESSITSVLFMDSSERFHIAIPMEPTKFYPLFQALTSFNKFSIDSFSLVKPVFKRFESEDITIDYDINPSTLLEFNPIPEIVLPAERVIPSLGYSIFLRFDYHSVADEYCAQNPEFHFQGIETNKTFEKMCLTLLNTDSMLKQVDKSKQPLNHSNREKWNLFLVKGILKNWLIEKGQQYLDRGFKIYDEKKKQYIENMNGSIVFNFKETRDWLEFKPFLLDSSSGKQFEITPFAIENGIVYDSEGRPRMIRPEDIEKLKKAIRFAETHENTYRVPINNFALIEMLYDKRMESMPLLKEKLAMARRLKNFKQFASYDISPNFKGKLRKYQEYGFHWLKFLYDYSLNGCLADDMGLGKTVQTLALFQRLKDKDLLKTSLLVAPVSTLINWEMEIEKFTDSFTIYRHHGASRDKTIDNWANIDIIITSYGTLRNDIELFQEFKFNYIVLDEAQNIKNYSSQISMSVKLIPAKHKLTLSGTPIENNTMELWSLFDFLFPGFLGKKEWFKKEWAIPVEKNKERDKINTLKQMIYPFVLRRKKEEVEKELPPKTNIISSLKMEEEQAQLYVSTAKHYHDRITNAIDNEGLEKSLFIILEGMLRLRQVCLFPSLLDPQYESLPSIKFDYFTELIDEILSEQHKVLIFSQFVQVLAKLKTYLDKQSINYSYIDGSISAKDRAKAISEFQENKKNRVFLLSLKAGGVGINLTAADYVILFDPWWNPAVEAQAIDRAHRIGQTKNVFVYRMVVKDTIEEKMLALQEHKRELVENLISSESKTFKNLTRDDILKLFQV